jgi:hypothetical protein
VRPMRLPIVVEPRMILNVRIRPFAIRGVQPLLSYGRASVRCRPLRSQLRLVNIRTANPPQEGIQYCIRSGSLAVIILDIGAMAMGSLGNASLYLSTCSLFTNHTLSHANRLLLEVVPPPLASLVRMWRRISVGDTLTHCTELCRLAVRCVAVNATSARELSW